MKYDFSQSKYSVFTLYNVATIAVINKSFLIST